MSTEPIRVPIRYGLVAELYLREPPPPIPELPAEGSPPWTQPAIDDSDCPW